MGRLDGRVAIVTGAGKGIGKGIALSLAAEGAKVVVASRSLAPAAETLAEIKAQGGDAIVVQVDIAKEDQVKETIAATMTAYGRLDILVNNAGLFNVETEKIDILDTDKWRWMVDTNLTGTFMMCKYAIPELLKSPHATIINISSPAGQGLSMRAAYGATKAGIISLTRSIAIQYPGKIRSNCICPGSIDTPGREASRKNTPHAKGSVAQLMQRDGKPRDIGAAAAYLASDDAIFVNAVVLNVDGALCGQRPKVEDLASWQDD